LIFEYIRYYGQIIQKVEIEKLQQEVCELDADERLEI
jgi:hypothetical protein